MTKGLLVSYVCLYGTCGAALNWQESLSDHLMGLGLKRGVGHPCVFHHPIPRVRVMAHGDDYLSAGGVADLSWLQDELM